MSIEIKIYGNTADEAASELRLFASLLGGTSITTAPTLPATEMQTPLVEAPAEKPAPRKGRQPVLPTTPPAEAAVQVATAAADEAAREEAAKASVAKAQQDSPETTAQDRADEKADTAAKANGVVTQEIVRDHMGQLKDKIGLDVLKTILPKLFASESVKKVSDLPDVPAVLNGVLTRVKAALADHTAFLPPKPADDSDY